MEPEQHWSKTINVDLIAQFGQETQPVTFFETLVGVWEAAQTNFKTNDPVLREAINAFIEQYIRKDKEVSRI